MHQLGDENKLLERLQEIRMTQIGFDEDRTPMQQNLFAQKKGGMKKL